MIARKHTGIAGQELIYGQGPIAVGPATTLVTVIGGHGGTLVLNLPLGTGSDHRIVVEKRNDRQSPGVRLGANGDQAFDWPHKHRRVTLRWNTGSSLWERADG